MKCALKWTALEAPVWHEFYRALPSTNLLQDPAYGRALQELGQGVPRHLIIEIEDRPVGLAQLIEHRFAAGLLHTISLDRGPLWLEGFGTPDHIAAFFKEFSKIFPHRLGRRRRVIPETPNTEEMKMILQNCGLKHRAAIPGYQTYILSLEATAEEQRARLKGNWRGWLGKAEHSDLICTWDESGRDLPYFLKQYHIDRTRRNYPGPSVEFLSALAREYAPAKNLLIGSAKFAQNTLAAVLIVCHGNSATWQAGWTSEQGRKYAAHHLLLWDALRVLKEKGIRHFDLGGVNDETAAGIKKFKAGMGGRLHALPGFYT